MFIGLLNDSIHNLDCGFQFLYFIIGFVKTDKVPVLFSDNENLEVIFSQGWLIYLSLI